jgi:hypothetical protein
VTDVLLLATTTGYQIRSFGEAAERLGVRLLFASDRCDRLEDPWWDAAIPVRFNDTAGSLEAILASGHTPAGVLAVGDRPTVLAAHVAAALGLPGNPPDAAEASRNKLAARRAFARAGLLTPAFPVGPASGDVPSRTVDYPAVVKPLALSGSRGVMRVDDAWTLTLAFDRLRRLLQSPDVAIERDPAHAQVLIESFVPGREYALEGVLTDGALHVLTIFDKPDPLDGPFFEETIYVTPSRATPDTQRAIVETVTAAVRALALRHGPLHAECRVNARGVHVLEVAARSIGGLCSKALRLLGQDSGEASLEDVLLRHAIGEPIDGYHLTTEASGVMMIPIPRRGVYRGVKGVDAALSVPGIVEVSITAKPDTLLLPLPEARSYLGFIFARDVTPERVERALRDAHARLQFVVERELTLLDHQ